MEARKVMKATIAEAVDQYIEERNYALDNVWREHEGAIEQVQSLLDKGFTKKQLEGWTATVTIIGQLKEKISNLEKSNQALIQEADYLRFELRKDDRDFYDYREESTT